MSDLASIVAQKALERQRKVAAVNDDTWTGHTQRRPGLKSRRGRRWQFSDSDSTGVAIGGTGARAPSPLEAYSVTKNSAKNAPKHVIFTPKIRKFSGEGCSSLPRPFLVGERTPLPYPTFKCPPLQLDPSYATVRQSAAKFRRNSDRQRQIFDQGDYECSKF